MAKRNNEVVAFCHYWLVVDEIQVMNIATHPTHRRRGLAQALLIHLLREEREVASLTLEVRKSNEAAQSLYEKMGFRKVGARSKYYSDNQEDAVLMTLTLK